MQRTHIGFANNIARVIWNERLTGLGIILHAIENRSQTHLPKIESEIEFPVAFKDLLSV